MDEQARLKSNIWKFYLYEILGGMFFIIPVIVLFWQENGLNLFHIMLLQSIFSIAVVALEVPTGYFADVFGRKQSLLLSGVAFMLGISVYSIGNNFYHFLVGELLFAFAVSFFSGAGSAFIYDTLCSLKQEQHYKKVWGKAMFYSMLAMGGANIIGGLVASISFRLAILLSIPCFAAMIPLAYSFYEPKTKQRVVQQSHSKQVLRLLGFALIHNRRVRWLICYAAVIFSCSQIAFTLYQPYFKLTGLAIVYFGVIFAAFQIVSAFASKYAHQLEQWLGEKYALVLLLVLVVGSYFLMSNFIFLFSFSFVFLQQFVRGFSEPVITDYINQLVESRHRATILSIQNLVAKLGYALILPIIGWMADIYTLPQVFTMIGIITLVAGTIVLILLHRGGR